MRYGEQRFFTLLLEIQKRVKRHGGQTRELCESDEHQVNHRGPLPDPADPPRVMTSWILRADLSACPWVEVAPHKTFAEKMDLPAVLQRQIAMYTPEAGFKLQRGDRFLGSQRGINNEMRKCICGLCVSTNVQPHASCTLFDADGGVLVQRHQTELCKSICLSRNGVSMLERLIRGLLKKIASRSSVAGDIRLTLQRDGGHDYLFQVDFFEGVLAGAFFIGVDGLGDSEAEHFRIPYAIGDNIDFGKILPRTEFQLLQIALERTFVAGDGQAFSLVLIAPELPNQDFEVAGIHFRNEAFGMFRARPLYLFVQAMPR